MDQNLQDQTTSPSGTNPPPRGVDPRSFVLPSKEIHDPLNAQRMSAGTLAAQEETATLPKAPPPPPLPFKAPPADSVKPLETYQSDVERYVREQNVSTVTAAAAEEKRRQAVEQPIDVGQQPSSGTGLRVVVTIAGGALILAAIGGIVFAYLYTRPYQPQQIPVAPFIAIDSTIDVQLTPGETHTAALSTLTATKDQAHLSVGLVAQLRLWVTGTPTTQLGAQELLSLLTPNMPPQLLRSVQPLSLLGVHAFNVNQPFLILSVDSYQSGYAGMLDWEQTMRQDLLPLFAYSPTPQVGGQSLATTIAAEPQVLASPFVDAIVENHDARVIKNGNGDTVLLWTFIDNSTILVTTNADTVHEILSRLKIAPQVVVPGQ